MNNIQDMTNDEFISHLMTGYSKHGALVQMVVSDCLQRGLEVEFEFHASEFSASFAHPTRMSIA